MYSDHFKVPSPQAQKAVDIASSLVKWSTKEVDKFSAFSSSHILRLKASLKSTKRSFILRQETAFHKFRSSDEFKKEWKDFLLSSVSEPSHLPVLSQHVSKNIFQNLIENKYAISSNSEEGTLTNMSNEDLNALRYVAGYVCRKVKANIQSSKLAGKDDLVLFVSELVTTERDLEADSVTWIEGVLYM